MGQVRRFARAGALAWLMLAAGLLVLPTSASPTPDDSAPTSESSEGAPPQATAASPPETSAPPATDFATAAPSPELAATGQTAESQPPSSWTPAPSATEPIPLQAEPSTTAEGITPTPSPTLSATPELATATETATPELATATETATPDVATATETSTPTATPSASPTITLAPESPSGEVSASFAAGSVLINEVAWSGTAASANDEWIELWNPGGDPIDLKDWTLSDGGDITVTLSGEIAAFGLYLLERTDDRTVSDIPADRIYTGSLKDSGETLSLRDPSGGLIDTANDGGGAWPAGSASPRASMERHSALDLPGSWRTFPGIGGNGLDADGNPIAGTPRQPNAPSVATPTPSATPTASDATPFPAKAVIVNEVAWAGTLASTSDEWIELLNPGTETIVLDGWTLTDDGDLTVTMEGSIGGGQYFVVERGDDGTISDQPADGLYSGALSNDGEILRLLDPTGNEVDVANSNGGAWPAGDASGRASMERVNGTWRTFNGTNGLGLDADSRPIPGTPHGPNSGLFPTPRPTWIPGRVVINEVLVRPHYDWEGLGGVSTADEFIELYNHGPAAVSLAGWTLDDIVDGGSSPYELRPVILDPGEIFAVFRSRSHIALNDNGDSVRLAGPDGSTVDKVRYLRVSAYNLSYGRLPDGDDRLVYGLWPTPGRSNVLYLPPSFPAGSILVSEIAWAGTSASANDEWIELWNPGQELIHLDGWTLTDDNDIAIDLAGIVPGGAHIVLERTDDDAIAGVAAHATYTGALADGGERLRLIDPSGKEIEVVNPQGGAWPAGDGDSRASMERNGDAWTTFSGYGRGRDAGGAPILGTPGGVNSAIGATDFLSAPACSYGACP